MRAATDLLSGYAEYHRDQRNIASHFVGVPMIVFAAGVLLARPSFEVAGWSLSPAWIVFAASALWYLLRGGMVLGTVVSASIGVLMVAAHQVAHGGGLGVWLLWGVGVFLAGWAVQFAGHWYEGRKPAFADDIVGLLVGPMFVVLEMLALLGLFKGLMAQVEAHAGPTVIRDLAHPVPR